MSARVDSDAIPVTVVTGFLGAGKTTLLLAWLAQYPRGDVAVIVNEIGEVGIDGELLAERARAIVEISGGCVCCTTHAELVRALASFAAQRPMPKRIFVETSGAASPAGVVRAVARSEDARLDGIVTVVDAARPAVMDDDLAAEQIGYADVLVLSHADLVDVSVVRAELQRRNAIAVITSAERGIVAEPIDTLLGRRAEDFDAPPSAHDGDIETLSLTHDGDVDEDRFGDWVESELARFAGRLLRMKGILAVAGLPNRMILQGVADRVEVTFGAPWADAARHCRLVLVGYALDRPALTASFRACSRP